MQTLAMNQEPSSDELAALLSMLKRGVIGDEQYLDLVRKIAAPSSADDQTARDTSPSPTLGSHPINTIELPAVPVKQSKRLIPIVLLVVLVLGVGGVAVYFKMQPKSVKQSYPAGVATTTTELALSPTEVWAERYGVEMSTFLSELRDLRDQVADVRERLARDPISDLYALTSQLLSACQEGWSKTGGWRYDEAITTAPLVFQLAIDNYENGFHRCRLNDLEASEAFFQEALGYAAQFAALPL